MNRFNSFKHVKHFNAHNSNKKKEKKERKNIHFKNFPKTCNITKYSEKLTNLTQVKHKQNWGFKTLKLLFLFNAQNHDACKLQEFPQIKHIHSSLGHMFKK